MHSHTQLNFLKSLPQDQLLRYINEQDTNKLQSLETDIKGYAIPENSISKVDRDKFSTILSYIEARISGLNELSGDNTDTAAIEEMIDTSQFKSITYSELLDILGLTIKQDNENKL